MKKKDLTKVLTAEQKQHLVKLHGEDFYYDEIIDWFMKYDKKTTTKVLNNILKGYDLTKKDWRDICQEASECGVEGGDWYETIGLDTMNTLLNMYGVSKLIWGY